MKEPRRWSSGEDSPDDEVVRLLRAAPRSRPMSPQEYARTWRGLRRLVVLPAAAGLMLWVKGGIAALAIGATSTATYLTVEHVMRTQQERTVESPSPSPSRAGEVPGATNHGILPDAEADRDAGLASQTDGSIEAAADGASDSAGSDSPAKRNGDSGLRRESAKQRDSLQEEIALLERARGMLVTNPVAAQDLLQTHAQRFPRGKLGMERQLMMIEVLQRQGRTSEARALAVSLLQQSRGSLYEARLERMLEHM